MQALDQAIERSLSVDQTPTVNGLETQAYADLARQGFCIVQDVLPPEQVAALRSRVIEQGQGEDATGEGFHDSKANQRIWMLVNKGRMFRDLVVHPFAESMMRHLLGREFLLSSLTANIARPGGELMYLHADQGYVDFWTPKPLVANILWMLDDFTEENGGTRLIPGSHLRSRVDGDRHASTVAAVGKAGSALVFDGRMIHGTGANRTADVQRHGILSYFCRPFVRQQENFFLGLANQLRMEEREAFLARLGYRIWAGLGRTEAPGDSGLLDRVEHPVGALAANGAPSGSSETPL
jgi:ectoine hydroxylase-related dioxygenase (phytanoyl-CoA dioxygenase family)